MKRIANSNGISTVLLRSRIKSGWDIDLAMHIPPKTRSEVAKIANQHARKNQNGKRVEKWWSTGLMKCPVPGCEHIASVITKVHCKNVHNLDRVEVKKLYGMPYKVK